MPPSSFASDTVLSVKSLTLRRDDGAGSAIFNDLNLDVKKGEIIILKGRSGAGKTTLLKCMAELNVYDKGEIELYGKKSTEYGEFFFVLCGG